MSRPSSSSISGPKKGSRQNQHRSRRSAAWEDDAWKIDSDDEEFVKASRGFEKGKKEDGGQQAVSPDAVAALGMETLSVGGSGSSSSTKSNLSPGEAQRERRLAPPARPHPFAASHTSERELRDDGERLSTGQAGAAASVPRQNSTSTASASAGSSSSTPTPGDWTLVGRSGSMSSARGTSPGNDESKGTANPASLDTSSKVGSGLADHAVNGSRSVVPSSSEEVEIPTRTVQQSDMRKTIHKDVTLVVEDPTRILERMAEASVADGKSVDGRVDAGNAVVAINGVNTRLPVAATMYPGSSTASSSIATRMDGHADEVVRINRDRVQRRRNAFIKCLKEDIVSTDELRPLAWAGVPDDLRPIVWMLLLGYLPRTHSVRASTLSRKRLDYQSSVKLAFQRGTEGLDQSIWHQIRIDVPRTNPGILLWQREATQRSLERLLYVWAIHHPASGYVQGINDLATPFYEVFLSAYISMDPETFDIALLPQDALHAVEADTFWCLSKLLEGIQDNYTEQQLGIQAKVATMGELVARTNPDLHAHFQAEGVEYMQIAFRWMNCLLMRELSVPNIVRLWDTYLADGSDAFSKFHVCVCAAFLNSWSSKLLKMDFQGIIMFLQGLPMQKWTAQETEVLLADAFLIKSLFGGTAHLAKPA